MENISNKLEFFFIVVLYQFDIMQYADRPEIKLVLLGEYQINEKKIKILGNSNI